MVSLFADCEGLRLPRATGSRVYLSLTLLGLREMRLGRDAERWDEAGQWLLMKAPLKRRVKLADSATVMNRPRTIYLKLTSVGAGPACTRGRLLRDLMTASHNAPDTTRPAAGVRTAHPPSRQRRTRQPRSSSSPPRTPSTSERRATAPRACSPASRPACPTSRPRTTKPSARWAS